MFTALTIRSILLTIDSARVGRTGFVVSTALAGGIRSISHESSTLRAD